MLNFFVFIAISVILVIFLVLLTLVLSSYSSDYEKRSSYECGFEPYGDTRAAFDVQFYIVGLLYIIFDVEVLFLVPYMVNVNQSSWLSAVSMILFLSIILVGFYYEWSVGLLNWSSQNKNSLFRKVVNGFMLNSITNLELVSIIITITAVIVLSTGINVSISKQVVVLLIVLQISCCIWFEYFIPIYQRGDFEEVLLIISSRSFLKVMYCWLGVLTVIIAKTSSDFIASTYKPELLLLLLLLIQFTVASISVDNLVLVFIILEGIGLIGVLLTISSYSSGGIVAGVKYFIFNSLSSLLILFGIANIYYSQAQLSFLGSNSMFNNTAPLSVSVGMLVKIGAAPFHQWVADVYSGSSTLVTMLLSSYVKISIFLVYTWVFVNLEMHAFLFELAVICSAVVGVYWTLKQNEIKRLMAYSSIVHVSYFLAGDVTVAVNYALIYTITSLLFFSALLHMEACGCEIIYLSDLKSMLASNYSVMFGVIGSSILSFAGLPPFAGFYGKLLVWVSIFEDILLSYNYFAVYYLIVLVVVTIFSSYYYFKMLAFLVISTSKEFFLHKVGQSIFALIITLGLVLLWTVIFGRIYFAISIFSTGI